MKPLELTIYPQACTCFIDDEDGCRVVPLDCLMHGARVAEWGGQSKKRLTEAELCAEFESMRCDLMMLTFTGNYWSSPFDTCPTDEIAVRNRADTTLRFATTPHYFEQD